MNPIFEQGSGRGIGHSLESFLSRFDEICLAHVREKRAIAFAFIFYDFGDSALRKILRNEGTFAKLDRLSGKDLSIFYLHSGSERATSAFNDHFYRTLVIEPNVALPCVVFFRLNGEVIHDIQVVQLENADFVHGFAELFQVVQSYLQQVSHRGTTQKALRRLKSGAKFLSVEVFRAALRYLLNHVSS